MAGENEEEGSGSNGEEIAASAIEAVLAIAKSIHHLASSITQLASAYITAATGDEGSHNGEAEPTAYSYLDAPASSDTQATSTKK